MGRYALILLAIITTVYVAHGEGFSAGHDMYPGEVPANEIIKKLISNEGVDYSNKIIVGDLNFIQLPFGHKSTINSSIRIINSEIRGKLYFTNITFNRDLNLSGTVVLETASFIGVKFLKNVFFNNTKFVKGVNFGTSQLKGRACFQGVVIDESANFNSAIFDNTANFANSKITNADFSNSVFLRDVIFSGAEFYNDALMRDIYFSDGAYFISSKFQGKAYFQESVFNGSRNIYKKRSINFLNARFLDDAYFNNVIFRRDATFINSRFLENAYFEKAIFNENIDFVNVKFQGDAVFWESKFNRSLSLNYTKFSSFKAQWKDIEGHLLFGEILYQSLIKNFKDLGRTDDANDCYYEYKIKRSNNLEFPSRMADTAIRYSCGYGVRPLYTIQWCIFIILLFAGITWRKDGINGLKRKDWGQQVHYDNFYQKLRDFLDHMLNSYFTRCLYFSTAVFVFSKPDDIVIRGKNRHLITHLVTIERILGWIFFGLFIATITRMMIG